jgi:inhibitor of KinA sporulation pathway (predicted exonuclease)
MISGHPSSGRKKKFVDTGAVKRVGPKVFEPNPNPVSVQVCETPVEEDEKFVADREKELLESCPPAQTTLAEGLEEIGNSPSLPLETDEANSRIVFPADYEEGIGVPTPEKPYYVVVDFEATCFKSERVLYSETEIIEFAAIIVDKETLKAIDEFDLFVRPVIHPQLDPFCTELTSITQKDVDNGFLFPTVLKQFSNWLAMYPGTQTFCSWGEYDRKQLQMECERNGLEFPFKDDYVNLKKIFSKVMGLKKNFGVEAALRQLSMEFEGTPHRGIDDVRNIVRLLQQIATEPF